MEYFAAGGSPDGSPARAVSGAKRHHRGRRRGRSPAPAPPAGAAVGPGERGLAEEGRALLDATVADLVELEGVEPVPVALAEIADALPVDAEIATAGTSPGAAAIRAAERRGASWLWPVAPETRGILTGVCRAAVEADLRLVGSPPPALRRVARRRRLVRRLRRAGLRVPSTTDVPTPAAARRAARELGGRVVVKPGRGAGGAGTTRVASDGGVEGAWSRALDVEPALSPIVQRYVDGVPASVVVLCGDEVRPLALSRQHVRFDPSVRYEGGLTPLRHPLAASALRAAVRAVRVAGGLRGLVGVDLVLGPDGAVIMEINPRLTTSYLGLRQHAGAAAAAGALRAVGCSSSGPRPEPARLPLGTGEAPRTPVAFSVAERG